MILPDRYILEKVVIPFFKDVSVCFVGLDKHTKHYPEIFDNNIHFIDINPKYLPPSRSTVIQIQKIHKRFNRGYFQCIIINGLAGFGLNDKQSIEDSFQSVYQVLDKDQLLIWGWSDSDEFRIIDPMLLKTEFQPFLFGPLNTWRYPCIRSYDATKRYDWDLSKIIKQNHTLDFYKK